MLERDTVGCFIRVFDGRLWYYSSITDIDSVQEEIDRLYQMAVSCPDIKKHPVISKFQIHQSTELGFKEDDVRKISIDSKLNLIRSFFHFPINCPDIVMWYATYTEDYVEKSFYSSLGSSLVWDNQHCGILFRFKFSDGDKKFSESYSNASNYFHDLENCGAFISRRIKDSQRFLKEAEKIKPGKYKVILSPLAAGVFAHESFGHKSEADFMLGDEKMKEEWVIGKKVGSDMLSIVDDGNVKGSGYIPFDDEGNKVESTYLIKNGVLTGRLHNSITAAELGEETTGNARAVDFQYEPIVRMSTTYIKKGDLTEDELFAGVDEGIYIDTIKHGSGLSTFTIAPSLAYLIKDGKIDRPLNVSVISGTVFDTLNRIDGLSDSIQLYSFVGGGCGKMEQGPLAVGFGGPYVRISEMDVL